METKKLTLVSHNYDTKKGFDKPLSLTLNVPEDAGFDLRGKLADAKKRKIGRR